MLGLPFLKNKLIQNLQEKLKHLLLILKVMTAPENKLIMFPSKMIFFNLTQERKVCFFFPKMIFGEAVQFKVIIGYKKNLMKDVLDLKINLMTAKQYILTLLKKQWEIIQF